MRQFLSRAWWTALTVILAVAMVQPAEAKLFRVATQPPTASAAPASVPPEAIPSPVYVSPPKCCPTPCITYREVGCCKVCCTNEPRINMILQVKDPRSCCVVDVPVCIPGCCKGTPDVTSRCGLLCRGVVWYDWCCGFSIKTVFTACGDLVVIYVNR